MTPQEIDNAILAWNTIKAGKPLECRHRFQDLSAPRWLLVEVNADGINPKMFEYRPAPEPKLRTIRADELPPAGFAVRGIPTWVKGAEASATFKTIVGVYLDGCSWEYQDLRSAGAEWYYANAEAWCKFEVAE